tara:strand:- start:46 stop:795 length:750 start_codon:yes stop_codon:yes gene_type:complete
MRNVIILFLATTCLTFAESTVLNKFGALVIETHKDSDEYFVNIQSKTFAEDKSKVERLGDKYFADAMAELQGKKIYQLRIRKSLITDIGIDALKDYPTIKYLELSNSNITDNGIKKIVEYCPQIERLNVWGCKNVTDKSLDYLRGLWKLEKLHLHGTKVTWDAANKHRGIMQSMAANEDLSIHVDVNFPTLYSFNMEEFWKQSYQKNVDTGKTNANFKVNIIGEEKVKNNKSYEDDLKKETDEPILNQE